MIRFALILVAALFATAANAQTSVTRNCVTQSCTLVADVAANAVGCRAFDGGVQWGGDVAKVGTTCTFAPRNFSAGVHVLTMRAYNADGESADSLPLTLTSAVPNPPAPPTNLRFQ